MSHPKSHATSELNELTELAIQAARVRKARVLDEAELEAATGGVKFVLPIIYGLIKPFEDVASPLAKVSFAG